MLRKILLRSSSEQSTFLFGKSDWTQGSFVRNIVFRQDLDRATLCFLAFHDASLTPNESGTKTVSYACDVSLYSAGVNPYAPQGMVPELEENLGGLTARAFAEHNRELWDNPEEDEAWADWQ